MISALVEDAVTPTPCVFFRWSIDQDPSVQSGTGHFAQKTFVRLGSAVRLDTSDGLLDYPQTGGDFSVPEKPATVPFHELANNLMQYSTVAKLLIPSLREMTPAEKRNLGSYYKRLYRKV